MELDETLVAPAVPTEPTGKRAQIVAAAERLFLSLGYGAVSMDTVARTAAVSKATLYAHFASKDELFATIVREKGRENPIGEALSLIDGSDMRAALEEIGQRVLRFMLRERTLAIYRVAIAESARFPELGVAFHENGPQRFYDRFVGWLEQQIDAGRLRAMDATVAGQQYMALLRSGVFMRASLALPPAPSDSEIDATVTAAADTFLRAFGPPD